MSFSRITTIRDLQNLVDTWSGSEGLGTDTDSHDANVERVARRIADDAIFSAGLNWGDDWSEFLGGIKPVWDYLED